MKPKVIGQNRVEAVYRSVHDRLWRSLLSYTGDADLASDAEAEAFAQVLRRAEAVDDVGAWVAERVPHRCWPPGSQVDLDSPVSTRW